MYLNQISQPDEPLSEKWGYGKCPSLSRMIKQQVEIIVINTDATWWPAGQIKGKKCTSEPDDFAAAANSRHKNKMRING